MKTLPILLFSSIFSVSPLAMSENKHNHDHTNATTVEHAEQHKHKHDTTDAHVTHADEHEDHHHHEDESPETHAKHTSENHDHGLHEHLEPHHGGIVSKSHPIHHELTHKDGMIYLYAEGLPEVDDKISVRLTILSKKDKQNVNMRASKDNSHRFDIEGELQGGDKVVALIKIKDEKTRLIKFDIPTED